MKLSHRDFRPHRRSRFVGRGPHRRPTIRVLLLGLLGLLVYLKFDSVAKYLQGFQPGQWWASIKQPGSAAVPPLPIAQSWSSDSLSVLLVCPILPDSCLSAGFPLGPEAAGQARAVLAKAALQLEGDASLGFRAGFRKSESPGRGASIWELERLDMQGPSGTLALARAGSEGPLCAGTRCLDAVRPQAPLASYLKASETVDTSGTPAAPAVARFLPGRSLAVRPVLRGRVVSVPPAVDSGGWLRLHHGRDLYTLYRGFARLADSLQAGAMVEATDTLGWIGPPKDSLAGLDLRVESRGALLDALAFLGIADTLAEVADAR